MRIEFAAGVVDHGFHIGTVVQELVAGAPTDDRGMVVVALDHLAEPEFGARIVGDDIGVALAPNGNLGEDHDALFIEVIEEVGRAGGVHDPHEISAVALHEIDIEADQVLGLGVAVGAVVVDAVEADQADLFPVEVKAVGLDLNATDTEAGAVGGGGRVSRGQGHGGREGIKFGLVEMPEPQGGGGHGEPGAGKRGAGGGDADHGLDAADARDLGGEADRGGSGGGVFQFILDENLGGAGGEVGLGADVLAHETHGVVRGQRDAAADAAPGPPGTAAKGVVGADGDDVGRVAAHPVGDVEVERQITAVVATEGNAVHPDLGRFVDGVEREAHAAAGPRGRHGEFAAIPRGADVLGVGVDGIPVAGDGQASPAGVTGRGGEGRIDGEGPDAVEGKGRLHGRGDLGGGRNGGVGGAERSGSEGDPRGEAENQGSEFHHKGRSSERRGQKNGGLARRPARRID